MSRWCLGGLSWCLRGVSMVSVVPGYFFLWCLSLSCVSGVLVVFLWCLGGVFVALSGVSLVSP